jgi:DNA polymerase III subunit delta'
VVRAAGTPAVSDETDDLAAVAGFPALLPWQVGPASEALSRRGGWPHALLLHGPAGIGKRVLAMNYARSLLCESPRADGLACGACAGCQYVAAGAHPDLRVVEPFERDDDGTVAPLPDIPIAHVRALIEFTQMTSHRRGAKVALIAPAERMNVSAANALLKTLEEPPAGTYLILVAHQPGRIPATVRSRCLAAPAPMPTSAQSLAWLEAQGIAAAGSVLAQAGGSPLAASALAEPEVQTERAVWLTAFARPETLSPVSLGARIDAAGREGRRERLTAVVDWLIAWTGDLARVASGGDARRNPDHAGALDRLSARVARVSLLRYHRKLLLQRAWVNHPLQPRLVAESLLIEYRNLFA